MKPFFRSSDRGDIIGREPTSIVCLMVRSPGCGLLAWRILLNSVLAPLDARSFTIFRNWSLRPPQSARGEGIETDVGTAMGTGPSAVARLRGNMSQLGWLANDICFDGLVIALPLSAPRGKFGMPGLAATAAAAGLGCVIADSCDVRTLLYWTTRRQLSWHDPMLVVKGERRKSSQRAGKAARVSVEHLEVSWSYDPIHPLPQMSSVRKQRLVKIWSTDQDNQST